MLYQHQLRTWNFWVSGLYPSPGISKNTRRFGNWITCALKLRAEEYIRIKARNFYDLDRSSTSSIASVVNSRRLL
jgi:hypothetical protein